MTRKPLIAGNWKMNLTHLEAIGVTQKLAFALPGKYYDVVDVAVLPPFTDLRSVQTLVDADSMPITYGGQDLSPEDSGAFTGDVSGIMLARLGCTWVVVGHSERRTIHGEDDELVNRKVQAALRHGLTPILCLGEGEEVRDAGGHVGHCTAQLDGALKALSAADVWALTSHTENFGVAVLEAMAAGCPVVISPAVNLAPQILAADAGVVADLTPRGVSDALLSVLTDEDRRQHLLQLTAAGRLKLARSLPFCEEAQRRFLDRIGSESFPQLQAVLASAETAIKEISAAKPQNPKPVRSRSRKDPAHAARSN